MQKRRHKGSYDHATRLIESSHTVEVLDLIMVSQEFDLVEFIKILFVSNFTIDAACEKPRDELQGGVGGVQQYL
jgi:hypothetical protein